MRSRRSAKAISSGKKWVLVFFMRADRATKESHQVRRCDVDFAQIEDRRIQVTRSMTALGENAPECSAVFNMYVAHRNHMTHIESPFSSKLVHDSATR